MPEEKGLFQKFQQLWKNGEITFHTQEDTLKFAGEYLTLLVYDSVLCRDDVSHAGRDEENRKWRFEKAERFERAVIDVLRKEMCFKMTRGQSLMRSLGLGEGNAIRIDTDDEAGILRYAFEAVGLEAEPESIFAKNIQYVVDFEKNVFRETKR